MKKMINASPDLLGWVYDSMMDGLGGGDGLRNDFLFIVSLFRQLIEIEIMRHAQSMHKHGA